MTRQMPMTYPILYRVCAMHPQLNILINYNAHPDVTSWCTYKNLGKKSFSHYLCRKGRFNYLNASNI